MKDGMKCHVVLVEHSGTTLTVSNLRVLNSFWCDYFSCPVRMPKRSTDYQWNGQRLKGLAASLSGSSSHAVSELKGQETSPPHSRNHALRMLGSVKRNAWQVTMQGNLLRLCMGLWGDD